MTDDDTQFGATAADTVCTSNEYRFVLTLSIFVLVVTSIPYVLGAALATEDRIFGGFVYALEDCYSYLAKMRQGAEGAWLFRIAYTPEPHRGALFFPFHLLLGKVAVALPWGDLTTRMVWVYHGARVVLGLVLLLTVYRFVAEFTKQVAVRRLAWLMVAFGGGLGWLLVALGQPGWLGSMPLDFILPEGFTFLVLYALPHIALARSLLLGGILCLLKAWGSRPEPDIPSPEAEAQNRGPGFRIPNSESHVTYRASRITHLKWTLLTGFLWLLMGLIVPFYVPVAWVVMGVAWLVLGLRRRRVPWWEGGLAGGVVLVSAPVVLYSAWVFTTDPVYGTWGAQNLILSPHPFHYLVAYGVLLALAAFAVRDAWHGKRPLWLLLAWVAVVPLLVYLPINVQRRLVEGVQIPLSLLAALGFSRFRLKGFRLRVVLAVLLVGLSLTNVMLVAGNSLALRGQPAPIYRDAGEVVALDWLNERAEFDDVVLSAYKTGNYLPVRAKARSFVGHGPETIRVGEKKALVAQFFAAETDDLWRRTLLSDYGVDWVFWGPVERTLGAFDPMEVEYLTLVYEVRGHALFEVGR